MKKTIGILGGMGPLATADLMIKIITSTKADSDREHIRIYIDSNTAIPDRTEAILHGGEDPVPEMTDALRHLELCGADCILLPCNSAHYFYPRLQALTETPILHMPHITAERCRALFPGRTAAVLGTKGALATGVYARELEAQVTELAAEAAGKTADVSVWKTISDIVPTSVLSSLVNETVLQVIFFALIFGLCLSYMKISDDERIRTISTTMYNIFDCLAEIMMKVVSGIMQYAPIGVAVLICEVFAKNGAKVAGALLTVTIACFLGYAIHVVLVYGGLLKIYGIKIGTFFKEARTPFITAFVTRSSNATLPTTMTAAENLGVDKEVYAFSLPLGATINMDGTAIYQGVCAFFLVMSCFGRGLTFGEVAMIVLLATLASIGTAGVPGAGAIMLAMVMQGIKLPITEGTVLAGAYAMILGIDAILDMGRTALNVVGDLTCTCCVAKHTKFLREDSVIK